MSTVNRIIEDFNNMENCEFVQNSGFERPDMDFFLGPRPNENSVMVIRNFKEEEHFGGKVLGVMSGELKITLKAPASAISLWFINAGEGFEAYFYNKDNQKLGQSDQRAKEGGSMLLELKFEHPDIHSITIIEPNGTIVLFDNIVATS